MARPLAAFRDLDHARQSIGWLRRGFATSKGMAIQRAALLILLATQPDTRQAISQPSSLVCDPAGSQSVKTGVNQAYGDSGGSLHPCANIEAAGDAIQFLVAQFAGFGLHNVFSG
jgi:hypothetical protein